VFILPFLQLQITGMGLIVSLVTVGRLEHDGRHRGGGRICSVVGRA